MSSLTDLKAEVFSLMAEIYGYQEMLNVMQNEGKVKAIKKLKDSKLKSERRLEIVITSIYTMEHK